jgi:hypothetical protein
MLLFLSLSLGAILSLLTCKVSSRDPSEEKGDTPVIIGVPERPHQVGKGRFTLRAVCTPGETERERGFQGRGSGQIPHNGRTVVGVGCLKRAAGANARPWMCLKFWGGTVQVFRIGL